MVIQKRKLKKGGFVVCVFFNRSAKTGFIVSDAQKYAYSTPTASNWHDPLAAGKISPISSAPT